MGQIWPVGFGRTPRATCTSPKPACGTWSLSGAHGLQHTGLSPVLQLLHMAGEASPGPALHAAPTLDRACALVDPQTICLQQSQHRAGLAQSPYAACGPCGLSTTVQDWGQCMCRSTFIHWTGPVHWLWCVELVCGTSPAHSPVP